jgi:subtilase family serine protease
MPTTNEMKLAISLPLQNTNELDRLLNDVYNPASPKFRKYLTPNQFTEQFGPTEADYEALKRFCKTKGLQITATHGNRLILDVKAQVHQVEKAFNTKIAMFKHAKQNRLCYAPEIEPSTDLQQHMVLFPPKLPKRQTPS